jgi:outer membrane receptor protein involved in Fe transport
VDTIAPAFMLWDSSAGQRLGGGATAFVAIDNLFDSQDPNTGVMTPTGAAAPIYRPEIGRTVRFGVRWSWSDK